MEPAAKKAKHASKATVRVASTPDEIPVAQIDGKITTVYWNICGLGQPVRYALEVAGVEYVDVRVQPGPGDPGTPEYKMMWADRKPAVGASTIFANLPYLMDGEVHLTQSNAILRYLGRKFGLMGDPSAAHLVDLVLDQVADFDGEVTGRCYRDFVGLKPYCGTPLKERLTDWARLLADKPFMTGKEVTVADLKIYETLRKLRIIEAEAEIGTNTLSEFPSIQDFMSRIEALPAMANYLQSDEFMSRPLNNVHAQFK